MLEDICDIALSIHFAKSEDFQSYDNHTLQIKKTPFDKLKCFKCYGTGIKNCSECQNTQHISFTHPFAALLNSVLLKKLNLDKEKETKEEEQFEEVYPIKEEEQDTDQKKLACSYCQSQCDQIFYYCLICPCLHICQTCQRKNIKHQHEILKSKLYSTCQIDLSLADQVRKCFHCKKAIQNYYSTCKTCMDKGVNFWVCDTCSDSETYIHSASHILEPVIDYNYQGDNQIETISQELQQEDKSISLYKEEIQENCCLEQLQNSKQFFLQKKNSSIVKYIEGLGQDQSPLLFGNKSDRNNKKNDYVSRVKFDLDEGLFSSYQFTAENKHRTKAILCPPKVSCEDRFSYNHSQISNSNCKQNEPREENCQFSFSGYKCDICQAEPIKNVRYHCSSCQDFDVCQKCIDTCLKTHQHITFDKIDYEQMKAKAMNKIFQQRDCNLKGSANLVQRKSSRSKTLRFSSFNV